VTPSKPEELLRELEARAERLAERKCHYMAGVLLQYYDGEFAADTKDARLRKARHYFEQARVLARDTAPPATPAR